jgi:hypothetical protein
MIATSARRVTAQTDQAIVQEIRRKTEMRLGYYAAHPDEIDGRLKELDEEWDVERVLETGSSALSLTGLVLSVARGRKWLLLTLVVQGFFMQHALQGWCPPLPVFRKLGIRTQYEIERERYALKALRGDFKGVERTAQGAGRAMEAVKA